MNHQRGAAASEDGITSVAERHPRIFDGELRRTVRFHREIRHVTRVRLRGHGVVYAVVCVAGIEVPSRRGKRGTFTFCSGVDMEGMFARRKALEVQRDLHALARFWRYPRPFPSRLSVSRLPLC